MVTTVRMVVKRNSSPVRRVAMYTGTVVTSGASRAKGERARAGSIAASHPGPNSVGMNTSGKKRSGPATSDVRISIIPDRRRNQRPIRSRSLSRQKAEMATRSWMPSRVWIGAWTTRPRIS